MLLRLRGYVCAFGEVCTVLEECWAGLLRVLDNSISKSGVPVQVPSTPVHANE